MNASLYSSCLKQKPAYFHPVGYFHTKFLTSLVPLLEIVVAKTLCPLLPSKIVLSPALLPSDFSGMKQEEIHLADVLRLLDEVTTPEGEYILHEIGFITFSRNKAEDRGRYRIITNCYKTGLGFKVKANMMRGIRDSITTEIRAVHIRLIIMFDGKKVVW